MIDLSANSGHNLGRKFTPKMLRALRRMLIYRVFAVLDADFEYSPEIAGFLKHQLGFKDDVTTHFVVLNWDIVLERHLECFHDTGIDYCIQARSWDGSSEKAKRIVGIAKVHGSSNWVYCDNCHSLFYDRYTKLSLAIRAGLIKADFRLYDTSLTDAIFNESLGIQPENRNCRECQGALGPHIATFSFKKSFRTHAFATSWLATEEMLTRAKKWTFIGYSLPEADYEFKHLLKTCQLKFAHSSTPQKKIDVILLNDKRSAEKYKTFFGPNVPRIYQEGLAGYVSNTF